MYIFIEIYKYRIRKYIYRKIFFYKYIKIAPLKRAAQQSRGELN